MKHTVCTVTTQELLIYIKLHILDFIPCFTLLTVVYIKAEKQEDSSVDRFPSQMFLHLSSCKHH